ncbi:hypothetical protein D3C76_1227520 [compost metagenome]
MRQRQRRQRPQPRITANGLPVIQQHDRLPIRRYLHRAQRYPFGNHWCALVDQLRPQQANAHAVGPAVQRPLAVERLEQAGAAEITNLRAHHQVKHGLLFITRAQRFRHLTQGCCSISKYQRLALAKRRTLAIDTAQFFSHDSGTAAQHVLAQEPARRRQIGPHALLRLLQGQTLPFAQGKAAPRRHRLIIDPRIQVGTGQRQHAILLSHHREAT